MSENTDMGLDIILGGVMHCIDTLMHITPEVAADSPKGRFLIALSKAVSDYENELYPELNLNNESSGVG